MKFYNFYLKHPILYYVLTLVIIFIILFSIELYFPRADLIYDFLFVLLIFAACYPINIPNIASKTLTFQCDPMEYLRKSDDMIRNVNLASKLHNPYRRNDVILILLNRSTALCDIDRIDEAVEIFRLFESNIKKMPPLFMATIYHDMAMISAKKGDIDNAVNYINLEEQAFNTNKWNYFTSNTQRKINNQIYVTANKALVEFKCGHFENAEVLYSQVESLIQSGKRVQPHTVTSIAYVVGVVKYNLKKYDEATERLQYVIANGGTMACRQKAEELLNKISEETAR